MKAGRPFACPVEVRVAVEVEVPVQDEDEVQDQVQVQVLVHVELPAPFQGADPTQRGAYVHAAGDPPLPRADP